MSSEFLVIYGLYDRKTNTSATVLTTCREQLLVNQRVVKIKWTKVCVIMQIRKSLSALPGEHRAL